LIKQVNRRVKSTAKFWVEDGMEAMLAVGSTYLSADGRADRFWLERAPAARAVGRNRLQIAAWNQKLLRILIDAHVLWAIWGGAVPAGTLAGDRCEG
jgi:hypothetical protein